MEKIYPCTLFIQLQTLFEFDEFSSPCLCSVSGSHIPLDGFSTPSPPVCDVSSLSPSFVEGRVTFEDPLVRSLLRASIRVCLTFPHGWSEVMDFWQKCSWPPPPRLSPAGVLLPGGIQPGKQDLIQVRSKGKLCFSMEGWGGESGALEHRLSPRLGGCFVGSPGWEGAGFGGGAALRLKLQVSVPGQHLCTWPAATAVLNCMSISLTPTPLHLQLRCLKAGARSLLQPLWASETRLCRKGQKGWTCFIPHILFLFLRKRSWALPVTIPSRSYFSQCFLRKVQDVDAFYQGDIDLGLLVKVPSPSLHCCNLAPVPSPHPHPVVVE